MTISAKIIADSISLEGKRITTFLLRYPRFIHAELMTHRVFSRNASSSRAIPVAKMIEDLRRDPAMPIYWGKAQGGMQAGEDWFEPITLADGMRLNRETGWLAAMEANIEVAEAFANAGYHKQIVNRLLEPWAHINVVVTATEYQNFFALRSHSDAQPEIKELSDKMQTLYRSHMPATLRPGEWHLPFITEDEHTDAYHGPSQTPEWNKLIKVSVARCARTSYLTHDGKVTTIDEDIALYDRLLGSMPLHASPAEHSATPDVWIDNAWKEPQYHGNLTGWCQHRRMIPGGITNESSYTRL